MRLVDVESIKGNEILAKSIFSQSGTVLMAEGTVIRKEYISHLMALQIDQVYIIDELCEGVRDEGTEKKIKEECQTEVKKIIDRFAYCGRSELKEIQKIASTIISDILEKRQVVFMLEGIRDKNEELYSHPLNVCAMSVFIALKMKLSEKKISEIAEGCLLHDIGFQRVVLDEKHVRTGEFTEKENQEIRKHVAYGYDIVQNEPWLSKTAKDIIFYHHERVDGSGYPMHLKGDRIDLSVKIVAACDVFDSMVYGNKTKKVKIHKALKYMKEMSGSLFDEEVIECMLENMASYPNGTIVVLNTGDNGIVLRQDKKSPRRPVVRLLTKPDGTRYEIWSEVSLGSRKDIWITDTIEYTY